MATARSAGASSRGSRATVTRQHGLGSRQPVADPGDRDEPPAADEPDRAGPGPLDRTAASNERLLGLRELERGQERKRLERREHGLLIGIVDREASDGRAPQRHAMPAERVGDRAHVRAAADVQLELDVEPVATPEADVVHRARPHGHLDRDAAPVEAVGALAADLHGRGRRHAELDPAREGPERRIEVVRDTGLLDDLALGIAGGRATAEADLGHVALVEPHEVPGESGCRARAARAAARSPPGRGYPRARP